MVKAYTNFSDGVTMTPQTLPIPGREREMIPNNAGGFGFVLDKWERLHRFLIMGSDGGTYYVSEQKLTVQNAAVVIECLKEDGLRTIDMAYAVNVFNLAPKTDQQLFVLALAMKHGNEVTKAAVVSYAEKMLRTGTHLLHFVAMLDSLGGWNRSKRRLIANWFTGQSPDQLAFQVLKYQTRDGWSMKDALRVSHPKIDETMTGHARVFDWICGRRPDVTLLPTLLACFETMKECAAGGLAHTAALYAIKSGLPREALPTEALKKPEVWSAMLRQGMPAHALLRNLGAMSALGLFDHDNKAAYAPVNISDLKGVLTDREKLRKARVHPFAVLLASLVYRQGHGLKSDKTWPVSKSVLEMLDDAYELAFEDVKPTGKRILVGIDVSASMTTGCIGTPIPSSTAAAAMALTIARLEPHARVVQFDTGVRQEMQITKRTALSQIENVHGGGTNLVAPIDWAESRGLPFDAFIILTDNETWAGARHATEALQSYRRKNPGAKLVCCAMAANHASVVDPKDPLQMGCAGLDANLPALITEFISR
jgi:60 kDa SS-A/Ro ribonucleoprotein